MSDETLAVESGVRVLRCEFSYCLDDCKYQKGQLIAVTADRAADLLTRWAQFASDVIHIFAPASDEEVALYEKGNVDQADVPVARGVIEVVVPKADPPPAPPAVEYAALPFEQIQKLAKKAGISFKGKSQAELVQLLSGPAEKLSPAPDTPSEGPQGEQPDAVSNTADAEAPLTTGSAPATPDEGPQGEQPAEG